MDNVCVQHEFHFLCIVERILTRIPVDGRMNTTRTERGPDFVPVVVHVPDHGRLMCVLSSTYARKNEANLKLFFLPGFCLGCSTLVTIILFSLHFPSFSRAHKCIKRTLNTHVNTCFVHKKREHERDFLRVSVESKREL